MAVDFPSDLIADVARAADGNAVEQARARLAGVAEAKADKVAAGAFAEAMDETDGAFGALAPDASPSASPSRAVAMKTDNEALQRFEAMMLQQMIQQMMPKEAGAVYGDGFAGDMWRSLQAEKLGEAFAERGGLGIAETVGSRLAVDGSDLRASTANGSAIVNKITLQMLRNQQDS